jgi:diacylglycerol kinase (ATP)
MKNQPFHARVGFALNGIAHAFQVENGFRVHVLATCAVVAVLWLTKPPAIWWAIAALTISAVMAAELFNTAIEHLADHLHPQQHASIRAVKDCAAGAVLLVSIGALGVAAAFLFAVVL